MLAMTLVRVNNVEGCSYKHYGHRYCDCCSDCWIPCPVVVLSVVEGDLLEWMAWVISEILLSCVAPCLHRCTLLLLRFLPFPVLQRFPPVKQKLVSSFVIRSRIVVSSYLSKSNNEHTAISNQN